MVFFIKRTWYGCLLALITITLVPVSAQAAFTLTHKEGPFGMIKEGNQPDSLQAAHTNRQILYAKPGEAVHLYRSERATFVSYVRWYDYDTDRAIPASRIVSTWNNDASKFKKNAYGWFRIQYAKDKMTGSNANYYEIDFTMPQTDSVYLIACDQSIWKDDLNWKDNDAVTEPTLSNRLIYEIHPASEMAARMEACKDMDGSNDHYLEEYNLIAPSGRQLYIGPEYMYHTKKITLDQYVYYARSNYYYINSQGNVTPASQNNQWKWYKDGEEDASIVLSAKAAQFAPVSSSEAQTVVYTLRYNSAEGVYFNVARFTVHYMDTTIVGPVVKLPAPTRKMEKIYEQNFNYDRPGVTTPAFWLGHLGVDESTYGYYDKNLDGTPSQRHIRPGTVTWSEYAITNAKSMWNNGSASDPLTYQHIDSTKNIPDNAKEGYMLYCDGSQQPGQLYNLKVEADLCPGSTMYFSAWLCDASSTGNGKCAPNLDFVVIGIDSEGNEHYLTTFTTGEFGVNAQQDASQPYSNKNRMARGVWYQIMFPVVFTEETTYPSYRLRVRNKGLYSDGNDFAIDDIRIYTQKPPVIPIQASSDRCMHGAADTVHAYLRVDYQAIELDDNALLYYQWRDDQNDIVPANYYNSDSASFLSHTFGSIRLLRTDEEIEASTLQSESLLDFDEHFFHTQEATYRYIKEKIDATTERYVLYIAQPMNARANYIYTGFVATNREQLGERDGKCGTYADLMIAGGTRINIDGVSLGDSVVSLCGHRSYRMDIVLTYIERDSEHNELVEKTTPCKADWLIGDSTLVNENPEVYKYTFNEIQDALQDFRKDSHEPLSDTIVHHLLRSDLLVLDTAETTMQPTVSLSYTAFPLAGSAGEMEVCLTPRFMHIIPSTETKNMVIVGNRDDVLPEAISTLPRKVRISNAQKRRGSFDVETYIVGEETEYELDTVLLIGSTNPQWEPIGLSACRKDDHNARQIERDDWLTLSGEALKTLPAGYDYTFHLRFKNEDESCERGYTYFTLRIVPDSVTWNGGDWNDDDHWDTFIPTPETSVVLRPNTDYDVTFSSDSIYDYNYTRNECLHIYVPHDASMAGQERVQIHGMAFVDISVHTNQWTLISIPIKGVVTGDLFVSQAESTKPFEVAQISQEVGELAYDRGVYEIYDSEYDAANRKWKTTTNTLDTPIAPGEGRMIGVESEDGADDPVIRLPKMDGNYRYYDRDSYEWLKGLPVLINRDGTYGKPLYTGESDITLKEIYEGVYLFGNPTFGYLNITELVTLNSDKLTGKYCLVEGETKRPKNVDQFPGDVKTAPEDVLLPPFRGVLLEGEKDVWSDRLTLRVEPEMVNKQGRVPQRHSTPGTGVATNFSLISDKGQTTEVYDLYGRLVAEGWNDLPEGLYIVREGNAVRKVLVNK